MMQLRRRLVPCPHFECASAQVAPRPGDQTSFPRAIGESALIAPLMTRSSRESLDGRYYYYRGDSFFLQRDESIVEAMNEECRHGHGPSWGLLQRSLSARFATNLCCDEC